MFEKKTTTKLNREYDFFKILLSKRYLMKLGHVLKLQIIFRGFHCITYMNRSSLYQVQRQSSLDQLMIGDLKSILFDVLSS